MKTINSSVHEHVHHRQTTKFTVVDPVPDILCYRCSEENGFLGYDADVFPPPSQLDVLQVNSIDQHLEDDGKIIYMQ